MAQEITGVVKDNLCLLEEVGVMGNRESVAMEAGSWEERRAVAVIPSLQITKCIPGLGR